MQRLAVVLWVVALCAMAFWGSTGIPRHYDDWTFVAAAALAIEQHGVFAYLATPVGLHWSPLWNLIDLLNFLAAGWDDDRLIRLLSLLAYAGGLAWCARLCGALGVSRPATLLGIGVLGLHHVRAAAIYSFDTYSQLLADLGSWVAAGLALLALVRGDGVRDRRMAAAALLPLIGLLVKEQAVAGAIAVLLLIGVAAARAARPEDRRRAWLLAGVLLAGVTAFGVARAEAGVPFSDGGVYQFCVSCVPRNLALLGGAVVLPVRTLEVVDAWRAGDTGTLAVVAVMSTLVALFLLPALGRRDGRLVAALAVVSLLPVALLTQVGELHAHTATFWLAMLAACATPWWRSLVAGWPARLALGLAAGVYLISLGVGLRGNLAQMRATGERAAIWRDRYDAAVRTLPDGSVVLVRGQWPEKNAGDYSLYRLTSPEFVTLMWVWVRRTPADRRLDVQFEWAEPDWRVLSEAARRGRAFEIQRLGDRLELTPLSLDSPQ